MPRNGSGTASIPNSFTSGNTISSSEMNANFTDVASELTNSLPRDGQAAMTGQLKITAGTASAPGMIFSTDTNTGLYRVDADTLGIAVGGALVAQFDSTGAKTASGENYDALPAGTEMLFYQATAPTGWTSGGGNDVAVRVVNQASGVGGSFGGSTAFSAVFAARTIAEANLPSHTHSISVSTDSQGAHQHFVFGNVASGGTLVTNSNTATKEGNFASQDNYTTGGDATAATEGLTSATGAHTHTASGTSGATGSGTAMDFAVSYMNWLTAIKN